MSAMQATALFRAELFQQLALCFAHPDAVFFDTLSNSDFLAQVQSRATALNCASELLAPTQDFPSFEADYIDVFQVGRRGKPHVPLNAGDYQAILGSRTRPEFLLQYSAWYKHFGLKTRQDDSSNELPDHIICQLEFIAWLVYLEHGADQDDRRSGYRLAQRDFCQRHLCDFTEALNALAQQHAPAYFAQLAALTDEVAKQSWALCDALIDPQTEQRGQTDAERAVNLWG